MLAEVSVVLFSFIMHNYKNTQGILFTVIIDIKQKILVDKLIGLKLILIYFQRRK